MAKKKPKKKITSQCDNDWLLKRFGLDGQWVNVTLPMTSEEMTKYFGKQCDEYEPLCGCCSGWMEWQKTGKATVMLERKDIIKLLDTN